MFEIKEFKEKLKFENGKLYSYFEVDSPSTINGCEGRKLLEKEIAYKRKELEELEKTKTAIQEELTELLKIDNALVGAGYCKLDKPVYKKLDGIQQKDENGNLIIENYTHSDYCSHKEEA